MAWIQMGTAKSGNYWLYNILQGVIKYAGLESKSFIKHQPIYPISKSWKMAFPNQQDIDHISITSTILCYRIGNIFTMPIDDFNDYVKQCSHVWLHSPYCADSDRLLPKFDKLIYIIRDPRDILISLSRYAFTPYRLKHFHTLEKNPEAYIKNNMEEITMSWLNHVCGYLKHASQLGIYFVFYERLLFDFETELKLILNYLGTALNDEDIQKIKHGVAFETMQKQSKDHLRQGQYGRWVEVLTDAQTKQIARIAGPLLELLGYALTKQEQSSFLLPRLPQEINIQIVDKIVNHGSRTRKIFKTKRLVSKIKTDLKLWPGNRGIS